MENFTLSYFGHPDALHSVDHVFTEGVNCLFAEEGSGKTSLLKGIAGINKYHAGSVLLDSSPLVYGANSQVNMVFDDLGLFEKRSIRYNLEYPLKLRKYPADRIDALVKEGMARFDLPDLVLDQKAFRVSPENRVKTALIRAFYRETPVLMLDDPLKSLSPTVRQKLFLKLALELKKRSGVIIYATDVWKEAEILSSPTLVLSYGYSLEEGLPKDIARSPKCLSTAKNALPFYNALPMTISNGRPVVSGVELPDFLPESVVKSFEGKALVLGFPPEGIVENGVDLNIEVKEILTVSSETPTYLLYSGDRSFYSHVDVKNIKIDLDACVVFDEVTEVALSKKKV